MKSADQLFATHRRPKRMRTMVFLALRKVAVGAGLLAGIGIGLGVVAGAYAGTQVAIQPTIFAPGVISGPAEDDGPTFSPDGRTVLFTRSNSVADYILISHRENEVWSQPEMAPFSGKWRDFEPTMAPDGSYLIFASNRPDPVTHHRPRMGNLWRVNRTRHGWSEPRRLPDTINRNEFTVQPAIAADGDLYFSDLGGKGKHFRLLHARYKNGVYATPVPMPFTDPRWSDMGPAVAADESFMIFNSTRPPSPSGSMALFIVFRSHGHWGVPQPLPQAINRMAPSIVEESRLGPDGHTLYFTSGYIVRPSAYPMFAESSKRYLQQMQEWNNSDNNIWKVDLAPWLQFKAHAEHGEHRRGDR